MRRIVTLFAVTLLAAVAPFAASAQSKLVTEGPLNEVKVNVPMAIAGAAELSYERILMEDLSVGLSGSYAWDKDFKYRYSVMPYVRWFFWKHHGQDPYPAAGFFIELNGGVFNQDVTHTKCEWHPEGGEYGPRLECNTTSEILTGGGLGVALGWKWISHSGFVGEIYTGAGRNFAGTNDDGLWGYVRGGISLGYRF
jgi:hypothetical protein